LLLFCDLTARGLLFLRGGRGDCSVGARGLSRSERGSLDLLHFSDRRFRSLLFADIDVDVTTYRVVTSIGTTLEIVLDPASNVLTTRRHVCLFMCTYFAITSFEFIDLLLVFLL
jgi:hypothetical protein